MYTLISDTTWATLNELPRHIFIVKYVLVVLWDGQESKCIGHTQLYQINYILPSLPSFFSLTLTVLWDDLKINYG